MADKQNMDDLSRTALTRLVSSLEEALDRLRAEQDELRHQSKMTIQTLEREAYEDSLTGLHNRRFVESRTRGRGGWFVLCDLDGFKRAQDGHPRGHAYGDEILVEFARYLLTEAQGERVAARMGGDEFVVWCPTKAAATRIRDGVRQWASADGRVGASAGMGRDMESADAALYIDKQKRKAA